MRLFTHFIIGIILSNPIFASHSNSSTAKSKAQRKEWSTVLGVSEAKGISIQKASLWRTKQLDSLKALGLDKKTFHSSAEHITDIYYDRVSSILGKEDLCRINLKGCREARRDEIKCLQLDLSTSIQMGVLKHEFDSEVNSIKGLQLPVKIQRQRINSLRQKYYSQVHSLIGDKKFEQWQDYLNHELDRRLSNRYGLSELQIANFKTAIGKYDSKMKQIRHMRISDNERSAKITATKKELFDQVKEIMTEQQYIEWKADYDNKHPKE